MMIDEKQWFLTFIRVVRLIQQMALKMYLLLPLLAKQCQNLKSYRLYSSFFPDA